MGGEGQLLTKSRRKSVDHLVKSKNHKARVGCSEASDSGAPCGLAFQALCILFLVYAGFFWATRRALYGVHVAPLPQNASLDQFSEGRTMKHIWYLADDIGIRQEGSIGLIEAAKYIKLELEYCKQRASNSVRVDIDQSFVYGSFNMIFLKHSITLAYKNHTNIAIRISSVGADEDSPAVLVNGHFDSAIGSPGAGDCASCVATMLEAVRLIIDSGWVPPRPIIFLFNGAEELFMLACHGFMKSHKWRSTIGALINIESSGTGGPDLVCQSGPGPWPVEVYAKAALYPMANTIAQDIFPHIPGDTDYRMFSEDYGDIPGLDIILLLEGYFYHTPYDVPENMMPGSMQIRGENLMALLKAFSGSSNLLNARDRAALKSEASVEVERRAVFFDFLGRFMIYYSFNMAVVLHTLPLGFVLFISSLASYESSGVHFFPQRILLIVKGALLHILEMALALVLPVLLAVIRLLPASTAMSWFAHPWLAVLTYVPISVAGLLIPRISVAEKLMATGSIDASGNMKRLDWGSRWGAVAMYSFGAAVGTHLIPGNGFFSFIWACFLLAANSLLKTIQAKFRRPSLLNFSLYALSLAVPILISLYVGVMLWQTLQEKMGMAGSIPHPFGFFVADIIMAATSGYVVILALSPLIPVAGIWLASSRIVLFLVSLSILGASVSPQFFPYNTYAPKRILLQRTFSTQGQRILGADYDLAVFDANSLPFVFKNVEAVPKFLGLEPGFSWKTVSKSPSGTWMAIYPISRLFVESYRFSAGNKVVLKDDQRLPHIILQNVKEDILNPDRKRIYVEIDMGSLHEVWASVLNITGPLTSWSFSDERLPVPEVVNGGPPSYICRLSGKDTSENWKFWLEANTSKPLQVDLAVLDHELDDDTRTLLHLFPSWAATIAGSTYLSSYLI